MSPNLDRCADCGGQLELDGVSSGANSATELYVCADCGGTGTYRNEWGPGGEGASVSGVVR